MNLPDFSRFDPLNRLREAMQAEMVTWEGREWQGIDEEALVRRLSTTGIDVEDIGEIETASDFTFEYRGQKVLVYIRDQIVYRGQEREYKYHIAHCQTIAEAFDSNRESRYVVASRSDGKFTVNVFVGDYLSQEGVLRELNVCKNCLMKLEYHGYDGHRGAENRRIFSSFMLSSFFEEYGGSRITHRPSETDVTARINQYSDDFPAISERLRQDRGHQCASCRLTLIDDPHLLHVHHVNVDRSDNRPENLEVLCIGCHSLMPRHIHVQGNPMFREFREKHSVAWEQARRQAGLR